MAAYRTYLLDGDEHVRQVIEKEIVNDRVALRGALKLAAKHAAVEVWQGSRLVIRVGAEFSLEPREHPYGVSISSSEEPLSAANTWAAL